MDGPPLGAVARALPVGWGDGGGALNKHSGGRLSSGLLVACQGASFWGQTLIVATELTSGAERPSPDAGGAVAASPRGLEGRAKRRPLVPVATGTWPPARLLWSQDKDGQLPSWYWPLSGPSLA